MYHDFGKDIAKMNQVYELPLVENNIVAFRTRLDQFKSILMEECGEIDDVAVGIPQGTSTLLGIRTNLADLLGDIMVFCASEAKRWNIPLDKVLLIIMDSNFSKLGENGKPIKDSRGKFLKGPNYWKPEDKIRQVLIAHGSAEGNIDV